MWRFRLWGSKVLRAGDAVRGLGGRREDRSTIGEEAGDTSVEGMRRC